jgi:pimeloyl-ACP methyl ester carboxylesterase
METRFFTALITALLLTQAAQAQPLSNPPAATAGFLGSISFLSILRSLFKLPARQDVAHAVQYTLADGTRVDGLLYIDATKGNRPLIIADFGLMSSSTSLLAGDTIEKIVKPGLLNANFLVVSDISSAQFYASNNSISLGGYDAGRILNELPSVLEEQGVPFTALHLLGESLGGLAVLEALLEDQRLGTNHFKSAITFSGVTDEADATSRVMTSFGRPLEGLLDTKLPDEGFLFLSADWAAFLSSVLSLGAPIDPVVHAGDFFYSRFSARLAQTPPSDWNPSVTREGIEPYLETSGALLNALSSVQAPAIVVHAQDDPIVDYSEFEAFATAQAGNPNILTFGTKEGSHCGFLGIFGAPWVAGLINRALAL